MTRPALLLAAFALASCQPRQDLILSKLNRLQPHRTTCDDTVRLFGFAPHSTRTLADGNLLLSWVQPYQWKNEQTAEASLVFDRECEFLWVETADFGLPSRFQWRFDGVEVAF